MTRRRDIWMIVPLLFGVAVLFLSESRGAFWLAARQSPDYAYLLSSLKTLETLSVHPVAAHPGIPLTLFGSALLGIAKLFSSPADFSETVLKNPETYLRLEFYSLLALFVLCQCLFVRAVVKKYPGGFVPYALAVACLTSTIVLERLTRVAPESMVLSLIALGGTCLMGTAGKKRALKLAIIAALLVTTKLTAFPILFFFWFALESLERKTFAVTFVPLASVLFLPLLIAFGANASLVLNAVDSSYHAGLLARDLWREEIGSLLLGLILLGSSLFALRWDVNKGIALTILSTSAMLLFFPSIHYGLPLFAALTIMLVVSRGRPQRSVAWLMLAVLFQIPSLVHWISKARAQSLMQSRTEERARTNDPLVVCNFGSSPKFSLHKADYQTGSTFGVRLKQIYGPALFCDLATWRFADWTTPHSFSEIMAREGRMLLLGPPWEQGRLAQRSLVNVSVERETPYESLYVLQGRSRASAEAARE